jgi:hypothetical protein
MNYFYEWPKTR